MSHDLTWFRPAVSRTSDPTELAAQLAPFGVRLRGRSATRVSYFYNDDGELMGEFGVLHWSRDRGTTVIPFADASDAAVCLLLNSAEPRAVMAAVSARNGWQNHRTGGRSWWSTCICAVINGREADWMTAMIASSPLTLTETYWSDRSIVTAIDDDVAAR